MSKDGLCVRCNYAYATTVDENLPVCENCKTNIEKEETRTCPADQTEMNKIFIKNVMIDKCPKCKGIWLDGDELNLLNNMATGEFDKSWSKSEKENNSGSFWKGFVAGAFIK